MQKVNEITPVILGSFSKKRVQEQVLTFTELSALCQIPAHPTLPKKNDKLLECVLLMAYLGLRVSEAINFTWQTVLVENKSAFVVLGKGQKQRLVFNLLNNAYIAKKSKTNPKQNSWTISRMAIWKYLQNKSSQMKLNWTITPHTLRRSFASILQYDLNLEAPVIQQLLGHSHFATTERYLKKDPRFLLTNLQRRGFMI